MVKIYNLNVLKQLTGVLVVGCIMVFSMGCSNLLKSKKSSSSAVSSPSQMEDIIVPSSFTWRTDKEISLDLTLLDSSEIPVGSSFVSITYSDSNDETRLLMKGLTDDAGKLLAVISVPSYVDDLLVSTSLIGDHLIGLPGNSATLSEVLRKD